MRKSMKKLIALTLACLMLATLFVGCGKKDDGGSSGGDTIKLGWMGSLTGDQAAYGTCESQTLKMLVEDLNANGGLLGKQVELICYDTKGDAQEAVNVAKRLCAQDQVCAIIGPNASGQCIAIQSVLDQYKISDMSTVATNEKVTMQDLSLIHIFTRRARQQRETEPAYPVVFPQGHGLPQGNTKRGAPGPGLDK